MLRAIVLPLVLVNVALCDLGGRAPAADAAAFKTAADALISSYIPSKDWPLLTAAVQAAASSASVTGDVASILYSALEASPRPDWFQSAIPSVYSANVATLESAIDAIRPTAAPGSGTGGGAGAVATVITITTTDSSGKTIVSTLTTSVVPLLATIITTTTIDSSGKTVVSTLTNSLLPSPSPTGSTTVTVSGASSTSGSGTTKPATTTSSTNVAPKPTMLAHGIAGVAALVGLVVAM